MNHQGRRSANRADSRALAQRQEALDHYNTQRDGLADEQSGQYMALLQRLTNAPAAAQQRVGEDQAFRQGVAGPAPAFDGNDPFGSVAGAMAQRGQAANQRSMAVGDTQAPWAHMARSQSAAMGEQALGDQLRSALLSREERSLEDTLSSISPNHNRAHNQQAIGQMLGLGSQLAFGLGARRG